LSVEHKVYGMRLRADAPIPGLEPVEPCGPCDLTVLLKETASAFEDRRPSRTLFYPGSRLANSAPPPLSIWRSTENESYRLAYEDGTEFILDRPEARIWARWPNSYTVEDAATYLLGPILGYWLRLHGIPCLHASAIAVDGRAIALIGPAGAGKSTTAAAFIRHGCSVLTEDVVAVREQEDSFIAAPGYPLVRLWPESVRQLYGSDDALPPLTPNWEKRYLDISRQPTAFHREPLPLGAIYFLAERRDDPRAPAVEAVPATTRFMTLVANTYTNYLLDPSQRAEEFQFLARLINAVPMRQVIPHTNPGSLTKLCDAILDDYRAMAS
jgi:hypothetical protein